MPNNIANYIFNTIHAMGPIWNFGWEQEAQLAIAGGAVPVGYDVFRECGAFNGPFATRVDFLFLHDPAGAGNQHVIVELKALYAAAYNTILNAISLDIARLQQVRAHLPVARIACMSLVLSWFPFVQPGQNDPRLEYTVPLNGGIAMPNQPAPNLIISDVDQFNHTMFNNGNPNIVPNPYTIYHHPGAVADFHMYRLDI